VDGVNYRVRNLKKSISGIFLIAEICYKLRSERSGSPMNKYCVLRNGSNFRVIYMDKETAAAWREAGWELRTFHTNEEAQSEMERWKGVAALPLTLSRAS
jgi:hypothetical protein